MKVLNVHERVYEAPIGWVGPLLDTLSSRNDALWPRLAWPRMALDRPLGVGAAGGHGPIRYFVEAYEPGRAIRFRFTGPRGFDGYHALECRGTPSGGTLLRHTLEMGTRGPAIVTWPLVFRPLHDALIEDALSTAAVALGDAPQTRPWSTWVRFVRWAVSHGQARPQRIASQPAPEAACWR